MAGNEKKLTVGFVTTVGARWPKELPNERHTRYPQWLRDRYPYVDVVAAESVTVAPADVGRAVTQFRAAGVDIVLVMIGAFGGDANAVLLAEKLAVPILLWAVPDPPFDGGRLTSNALVAATMNCAALKRMDFACRFVYGSETDPRVQTELDLYIRCRHALKRLNNTFLGLIGYRPTAFYSSTFDEILIRKTFGVRIEECDLTVLFDKAKQVDARKVAADMDQLRRSTNIRDLPEQHLDNHSRLYFAFKDLVAEQGFDAITLKCWPEMGDVQCTPCAVMSRLADEGLIIACEGDVDATLSMLLEHYITGTPPFMCDLISIDEQENSALFWHCGQAARQLHDESSGRDMMDHSLAGQGTVFEGTLKPGRVTVCRISRIGDAYKLFLVTGTAVSSNKELRGVMSRVVLDKPVLDTIYTIADAGVPHHYSIVWADISDELEYASNLLDIETIEVQ